MSQKRLSGGLRAALEFGPIAAYLVVYLILRDETFVIGGTSYSGLVTVTAAFIPIFVAAILAVWLLTGGVARVQVVASSALVIFGALGVWMNDARFFQMKPTVIYVLLGSFLGIGLLRGQSWLKVIMADAIPMREEGWMILTRRVTALFFLSALANEIVWRTQSEAVWVFFETIGMILVMVVFFLGQISLVVEHAKIGKSKKRKKPQP
ncbi:MAG: septation protein IspZ [Pseudomonadota bacterium]